MAIASSSRERPDQSNTTERTIASRRPCSTSASWNISRSRSLEWELACHRATARPGRFAGISCSRSISPSKRNHNDRKYSHSQRWTMNSAFKRIASHSVLVRESWQGHVRISITANSKRSGAELTRSQACALRAVTNPYISFSSDEKPSVERHDPTGL